MKSEGDTGGSRSYHQRVRAASAAETEACIRAAANAAFAAQRFDQVTLDDIARRAQVRVPTILRHFSSKENLFILSTRHLMRVSQQARAQATPTTLHDVVTLIVKHFEQSGPLILHFLNQEEQVPGIRAIIDEGRDYHRRWVMGLVATLLPPLSITNREWLMVQIYALTDVRLWQTLRHSLGQTCTDTERIILELIEGAIATAQRKDV